jgi:hypothetical protein
MASKNNDRVIIDGNRVFKAANVRNIHPVTLALTDDLSKIDSLRYIKIYNDRVCASNQLSSDRKKEPVTKAGQDGIIGVQLLVDPLHRTIQFYSLTASENGNGRRIVSSVVRATPDDWMLAVPMDWSGGFWRVHPVIMESPRNEDLVLLYNNFKSL